MFWDVKSELLAVIFMCLHILSRAALVYQSHSFQGKWYFCTVDAVVGPECSQCKYCIHLQWPMFKTLPFFETKSWGSFVSLGLPPCFCNVITLIEWSEAVDTGEVHRLFCWCSADEKPVSWVEISDSKKMWIFFHVYIFIETNVLGL